MLLFLFIFFIYKIFINKNDIKFLLIEIKWNILDSKFILSKKYYFVKYTVFETKNKFSYSKILNCPL